MAVDSSFMEVEEYVQYFHKQLQEDRAELESTQKRVLLLLNAVFEEFPDRRVQTLGDGSSILNSLFENNTTEDFFLPQNDEERRKKLAQERRAEYNQFLQKKEEEALRKRIVSPQVTPRSILESVDYEKVLAKRKAEESEFRNLHRAEPSLDKSVSVPVQNHSKYAKEEHESVPKIPNGTQSHNVLNSSFKGEDVMDTNRTDYFDKKLPQPVIGFNRGERRGGGGDPLRDFGGNLITSRSCLTFPSEQHNLSKNKQLSYREELRRQIEEKRALEAEEKRRLREHDEQIARRIEEQRLQMLREYEEEQIRTQRKSEQRDRERLQRLEEFQLRDAADRRKRMPPPPPSEPIVEVPSPKEVEGRRSPPVPSVRSKVIMESASAHPLPTEVKPENIFSSLSEIRRTLMQEQLQARKDLKNSYEVTNRRTVPDVLDDDDDDIK